MSGRIIVPVLLVGAVVYWFWSMRPERSRWPMVEDQCSIGSCKTTLWVEIIVRGKSWLSTEMGTSTSVLGEFPDYISCAAARIERVMALEDQHRKEREAKKVGGNITILKAHRLVAPEQEDSLSVIADDGPERVVTKTFFCGYRTLVPDRHDSPSFLGG